MKAEGFGIKILAQDGLARRAQISTPHGEIETPAFMPVATFGAVRGISPDELATAGAQILLSNTYHLHDRPGEETIEALGGLHGFTGWTGPWLTDSGGFQVTSMSDRAKIDEDGVTFQSAIDGRRRSLTPEIAIQIQEALGSDIAMVLDECIPIAEEPLAGDKSSSRQTSSQDDDPATARSKTERTSARELERAMQRTLRWAARSQKARRRNDQAVFAIVQGGASESLRRESAIATAELEFDGYAHGGLGLGESRAERRAAVAVANQVLPADRPRYLMGLGQPIDLLDGIAAGVDLFDCVVPTRNGRHGLLFTSQGTLRLRNARYERDDQPVDPACACPACQRHSRGYLRHLIRSGESLGRRLTALHNLTYYFNLLSRAQRAIEDGQFDALHAEIEELAERPG
ncbi:MAG: tRNA guanosine(34) transglycosylase Tgt [Myxococcales bacterium]|nr:tRNA guanosine(34) transglycosylase Tgt [Myxococcales bacterium]HIK84443.1 tRNA guanosine(34) transglycosylase Tgt [Myxococcales bacterium]